MDVLKAIVYYLVEFTITYLVEVICFAIGWNFFLCMAWENLPVLTAPQIFLTVLGLKFCKFSIAQWYHGKKEK